MDHTSSTTTTTSTTPPPHHSSQEHLTTHKQNMDDDDNHGLKRENGGEQGGGLPFDHGVVDEADFHVRAEGRALQHHSSTPSPLQPINSHPTPPHLFLPTTLRPSTRSSSLPPLHHSHPPRRRSSSVGELGGSRIVETLRMEVGLGSGFKDDTQKLGFKDFIHDEVGISNQMLIHSSIQEPTAEQDRSEDNQITIQDIPNDGQTISFPTPTYQLDSTNSSTDFPQIDPTLYLAIPNQQDPEPERNDSFSDVLDQGRNDNSAQNINAPPEPQIDSIPTLNTKSTQDDTQHDSARITNPLPSNLSPSSKRIQFRIPRSSSLPPPLTNETTSNKVKDRHHPYPCVERSSLLKSRSLIDEEMEDVVIEEIGVWRKATTTAATTASEISSMTGESAGMQVDSEEMGDGMRISNVNEQPILSCPLTSPEPSMERRKRHPDDLDRAAKAIKKLKLPFRSPMTRNNLHKYLGLTQPTSKQPPPPPTTLTENRPFPKFEESKPSPSLRVKNIASTRSSKPFKSPCVSSEVVLPAPATVAPNSSSDPSTATPLNPLNQSAEITALERRIQILKQAQRVSEHSDDRLEELINQWLVAGRTVVEKLFAIMPEPCAQGTRSFFDEPVVPVPVPGDDAEVWDYGRMMSTLQVDPELLGWDEENADWRDV